MSTKVKYGLIVLYTLVAGGVFAFYGFSWLTNPGSVVPSGISTTSFLGGLGAGRNFAIDLSIILVLALRRWETLGYLLLTMGLIELYDGVFGLYVNRLGMATAPLIDAFFYFACTWYLLRSKDRAKTA
jgi:hypothetical protein